VIAANLALLSPTGFVSSWGYLAIFVLSVLQSCCIPTSSELTLGFGGVLASQGTLSLPGVIVAGVAGEVVGAYIAWGIGKAGGRPLVERYGRHVLLSPRDLDRAQAWYGGHERWGVFGSRLLPVIRNFVAVPAGVARVPALRFGVLTAFGSLIWVSAMAGIGYTIGNQWKTVMNRFSDAGYLLGALALVSIVFLVWHRWRNYQADTSSPKARHFATRSAQTPSLLPDIPQPRAVHPAGTGSAPGRPAVALQSQAVRVPQSIKVPLQITAVFWAIKLLSTAMGESLSDALVHGINQYLAVSVGFLAFAGAMTLQLRSPRYNPWKYWFAVAMVAVFGTMAADVLHIGLHIPYLVSSLFYLVCLTVIFALWHRVEGTLSIHSIHTRRREIFYWLAVLATFALGTAVGDLTAVTFHLGYLGSAIIFCVLFAFPGLAYAATRSHEVLWFWTAYILTRPLGASFADWFGFPPSQGGLGLGHALSAVIFAVPIVILVARVASSHIDNPPSQIESAPPDHRRPLLTSKGRITG
jgi:uncharacterized membrane-anchored protein/membrane protein DedA with SNARE-associated domain